MTGISECNCGNCDYQSTSKCPMKWDGFDGNSDKLSGFNAGNKLCGCLSHPKAREVLMRGVVNELIKRAKKEESKRDESKDNESYFSHTYARGAYLNSISVIRDGVKRE